MKKLIFILTLLSLLHNINVITKHEIMSYEEYATIQHEVPYIFKIDTPVQCLYYFGANHSCDPANQQYPVLSECWNQFLERTGGKNCVVFVEGSLRKNRRKNEKDAIVNSGGEGGLLTFYAQQIDAEIICPEPDQSFLEEELLKSFTADEIVYLKFVQHGLQYHRDKNIRKLQSLDDYMLNYFHYNQEQLDHCKKIHCQLFDTTFDADNEQFFYTVTNPVIQPTLINHLCRKASIIRDQSIVECVDIFRKQGKNIFIAYGVTHAVMQKDAVEKLYELGS